MKSEQRMNEDKNILEVFFTLFGNWRSIADKKIFSVYYTVSVDPQMRDNEPRNNYIFEYDSSADKKINISEYGKHLKVFLDDKYIIKYGNFVSQPSVRHYGEYEYGYIIDNLSINTFPIISNFNYIIQYIFESSTSKTNKEIMISTIKNSISWGECFVMNMIASDYILGEIREDQNWRKLLKDNLMRLNLDLKNYDGAEQEFIENHAGEKIIVK